MKDRGISSFCSLSVSYFMLMLVLASRQCLQIGPHYELKNKAALQCKSDVKLLAALFFISYSSPI